jgi:hypothetical protein
MTEIAGAGRAVEVPSHELRKVICIEQSVTFVMGM